MPSKTKLEKHLKKRIKECEMERRSMEIWLSALTPANFVLVGLAGVLSLAAGASILIDPTSSILTEPASSILTEPDSSILTEPASSILTEPDSSILTESALFTPRAAGIMALISSAFTFIHNRLGCDAHQAEIRRLKVEYHGLETKYETLSNEDDAAVLSAKIEKLDSALGQLRRTASDSPALWSVKMAKKEVFG